MKKLVQVVCSLLLVSCSQPAQTPVHKEPDGDDGGPVRGMIRQAEQAQISKAIPVASSHRFSIVRTEVFRDSADETGQRAIYIITDTLTGTEYVGVSGIGMSRIQVVKKK